MKFTNEEKKMLMSLLAKMCEEESTPAKKTSKKSSKKSTAKKPAKQAAAKAKREPLPKHLVLERDGKSVKFNRPINHRDVWAYNAEQVTACGGKYVKGESRFEFKSEKAAKACVESVKPIFSWYDLPDEWVEEHEKNKRANAKAARNAK